MESGAACTAKTRFQVCSLSKQFVAVAAMLLAESGHLDLREPVDRRLPQCAHHWRRVTLHHLLSHTAGVPHWREAPGLEPERPMGIGERLEIICAAPLRGEPGSEWHYSSPGFMLAAFLVERASGRTYPEFVAERILSPLHMTGTTIGTTPSASARGYKGGQPVNPWDLGGMSGTGDVWSTAGDMSRFVVALHSGELTTAASLHAICTAQAPVDQDDEGEPRLIATGYGYGTFVGTISGHRAYYHPGDNPGYRSFACWFPDQAASIVILTNDEATNPTDLLRQLLPIALGRSGDQAVTSRGPR